MICAGSVPSDIILLHTLHINLELIKKENISSTHAPNADSCEAKLKEGIYVDPDTRKLFSEADFVQAMDEIEEEAWNSLRAVEEQCLCNLKDPNYRIYLGPHVESFSNSRLQDELNYIHGNLRKMREGQGERFRQGDKNVERRCQRKWNVNIMADYWW